MSARYRHLKCVTDRQTETLNWVNTALCITYHEFEFMICRVVDKIVKRLSIRAWHLFIAAQWRHRLGSKENAAFMTFAWPQPYSTPILGCSCCTRPLLLGLVRSGTLSYLAVPLFSKYSNLCENHTDGQTTCNLITALCVASCGN